jgi:hypothetical protein
LLVGAALDVAEDERLPQPSGQSADFLVQNGPQLAPHQVVIRGGDRHGYRLWVDRRTPCRVCTDAEGGTVGDTVQPAGYGFAATYRTT